MLSIEESVLETVEGGKVAGGRGGCVAEEVELEGTGVFGFFDLFEVTL